MLFKVGLRFVIDVHRTGVYRKPTHLNTITSSQGCEDILERMGWNGDAVVRIKKVPIHDMQRIMDRLMEPVSR